MLLIPKGSFPKRVEETNIEKLANLDLTRKWSSKLGATENAGVENVIRAKMQGWKMQE